MGELRKIYKHMLTDKYTDAQNCREYLRIKTNLVYDSETRIVYYAVETQPTCPYISANGKYCCFVENEIKEV